MSRKPDFTGWATKAGLKCSDGRTITPEAFKHQDKQTVPLVWHHKGTDDPENILGHAVLTWKPEGIWAEAYFNDNPKSQATKRVVQHGDVKFLSILANELVEKGKQVLHGMIREVSLVMAGANPGAKIDFVALRHADGSIEEFEDEAVITTGETLAHSDEEPEETIEHADSDSQKTAAELWDELSDEQKSVVQHMIEVALMTEPPSTEDEDGDNTAEHSAGVQPNETNDEGNLTHQEGTEMTRNVFDQTETLAHDASKGPKLTHAQMKEIVADAVSMGSFKDSLLKHAEDYGITNIEELFPDAKSMSQRPEWVTREIEWVESFLNATRKLPFSKIKSWSADLTHEEARAKGYIKGNLKKEQFFAIQKRETGPKTIYKKQRLDRDDIIDITDFDVVAWLWVEMRFMLREEIARAILVGDGREVDDPDKIDETKIRPIAHDDDFYTDKVMVPANVGGSDLVEAVVRARGRYKGEGQPNAYMTRDVMNNMLLTRDRLNRRLYRNRQELAAELEVNEIVTVDLLEGAMHDENEILMILVRPSDYSVGSTRGGEITPFQQFDMDFNQEKLLIEGRMSGALTKPKTAQVILRAAGTLVTPEVPEFDPETGVVTIPTVTGVTYVNAETDEELTAGAQDALDPGESLFVAARPDEGYHFPHNFDADWTFARPVA